MLTEEWVEVIGNAARRGHKRSMPQYFNTGMRMKDFDIISEWECFEYTLREKLEPNI